MSGGISPGAGVRRDQATGTAHPPGTRFGGIETPGPAQHEPARERLAAQLAELGASA
jgi:hypothetical protein